MQDIQQSSDVVPRIELGVDAPLTWRLVKPDGRSINEVKFEESVVMFFLEIAELLVIPKSLAAIYGICFASGSPLSYSEVRDRLNISAGSISQGLKALRNVGALKVVILPADHRELYAPDLELRKLITHYLDARLEKQIDLGGQRLAAILKLLSTQQLENSKVFSSRLTALQGWHEKARGLLPFVRTFLKLT